MYQLIYLCQQAVCLETADALSSPYTGNPSVRWER